MTATAHPPTTDFSWPTDFDRIPLADWVTRPMDEFGLRYDDVGRHGYYKNLEPLVAQAVSAVSPGDVVIDFSGGTGLFSRRLLQAVDVPVGVVNVDASAKFLRVALERSRSDERTAFRRLEWRKSLGRLDRLDDVLDDSLLARVGMLVAANGIHLYHDLPDVLDSWYRSLSPRTTVLISCGSLKNPAARREDWILDEVVEGVNRIVADLVAREPAFARYRPTNEQSEAHARRRREVFVPARPLTYYTETLGAAGFDVLHVTDATIFCDLAEFQELLATYHEHVLGWVGGTRKVEGVEPDRAELADRHLLIRLGLEKLFAGESQFPCTWTYLTCRRRCDPSWASHPDHDHPG